MDSTCKVDAVGKSVASAGAEDLSLYENDVLGCSFINFFKRTFLRLLS